MHAMKEISSFVRLSRLHFLYGGFAGVALGAAAAHSEGVTFSVARYLLAQAIVTAFHLMVHYSNDYFDQESDREAKRTAFSGGSGMLVDGSLSPIVALRAAVICAIAGLGCCALAAIVGLFTLAGIGVLIAILAWAYSAPPLRLLARGIGEFDAALVVAILVPLAGYSALTGRLSTFALVATIPGAVAMLAMMLCAEIPDVEADRRAGKRNLVVRIGISRARIVAGSASVATLMAIVLITASREIALTPPGVAAFVIASATTVAAASVAAVREIRPGRIAFAGVALYAVTVTALTCMYGTAAT